jgi:long-chain fatty acid transport protein
MGLDGADESGRDIFLIPFYGQSFEIDSNSSWAITVSALGGMNTDFKRNPFQPIATAFGAGSLGNLGIDLKQVSIGGTYARKVTPELSLGATLALVIQQFQARGLSLFGIFPLSTDPNKLSDNGKSRSTGIGLNLGAMYDLGNGMTIGFNYAPEIDMSEFDEYAGLFAQKGDFDIPSHYSLGFSMPVSTDMTFAIDYRRINYTDVPSVSNDSQRLTDISGPGTSCMSSGTNLDSRCLGGADGAGFGWDDMDIIKFGIAWEQSPGTVYRVGWNHGDSPIEAEDVVINFIAPGVVEDSLTLGMTKNLTSDSEITVVFIHTFANDVSGDLPVAFSMQNADGLSGGMVPNDPAGVPGTATIEMEQNFIEVQYGKRF